MVGRTYSLVPEGAQLSLGELQNELATDPEFLIDIDSGSLSRHARGICGAREKLR